MKNISGDPSRWNKSTNIVEEKSIPEVKKISDPNIELEKNQILSDIIVVNQRLQTLYNKTPCKEVYDAIILLKTIKL